MTSALFEASSSTTINFPWRRTLVTRLPGRSRSSAAGSSMKFVFPRRTVSMRRPGSTAGAADDCFDFGKLWHGRVTTVRHATRAERSSRSREPLKTVKLRFAKRVEQALNIEPLIDTKDALESRRPGLPNALASVSESQCEMAILDRVNPRLFTKRYAFARPAGKKFDEFPQAPNFSRTELVEANQRTVRRAHRQEFNLHFLILPYW